MGSGFLNKVLYYIGLEDELIEDQEEQFREDEDVADYQTKIGRKGKVVNIHTASQIKMIVCRPDCYEDSRQIVDNLKNRKPTIVNLETLDVEVAQRIVDFISGAAYSLEGNVQKVTKDILVISPSNVDVSGDVVYGMGDEDLEMPWAPKD
ncbi:MAG: cell division protein SepF [Clostridia bacterium]|nr:cell division protein SepF [Clostridia bacterium]